MNKKLIWILAIILIGFFAFAYWNSTQEKEGIEVELDKVEKRTVVESVTASGKIFPETEVKISSDVSGEIVELYVQEGDSVKIGQPLAKIDPEAYVSSVERGQASVDNAKAQLSMSKSNLQNSIAQKSQIEVQLINAEKIYSRNAKLFKDGVISEQDLENAKSSLDVLKANMRSSDASIQSGRDGIKASEYTVKSMSASLKELRTNLQRTSIASPSDGVVSMLNVEQGERVVGTIQMTGTELMRISDLSMMEVRVEVSENDILSVDIGDKAEVEIDAYFDHPFDGFISEIANSASNAASTSVVLSTEQVTNFIVKIRIDPNSYKDLIVKGKPFPLRPGMSASVNIHTDEAKDVATVPIQAVTTRLVEGEEKADDETDLLEVVFKKSGDTVTMVEVKTGIQDDDFIHLVSGLEIDDEIVIGPYNAVAKKLEEGDLISEKKKKSKKK